MQEIPRLAGKERLILKLLIASPKSEAYGLQLVEQSNGELARGTVYVTLDRMQERGLVESRREERPSNVSGIARRLYKPTGHGLRVYRAWERLAALGERTAVPALG